MKGGLRMPTAVEMAGGLRFLRSDAQRAGRGRTRNCKGETALGQLGLGVRAVCAPSANCAATGWRMPALLLHSREITPTFWVSEERHESRAIQQSPRWGRLHCGSG